LKRKRDILMPVTLSHTLYFIRHGETDWNREGRLQGQRDIPINAKGVDQACDVGRRLRTHLMAQGLNADEIAALHYVASPLGRTVTTMRLVRQNMGLEPDDFERDAQLLELSFGDWEGLTWGDVKHQIPQAAHVREKGKWDFQPPKGESYAMLAQRIEPWLRCVQRETVVVSHGGVARVLLWLLGGLSTQDASSVDISQGRILIFGNDHHQWV
jgi:broad specificity phosphatase PhoE